MTPSLPIFSPSPEVVPRILDDLCDAELSLREIAEKACTTVEALSLWMASEEIQSRIALIQSTIAQRTRLAATCFLPGVVRTVNRIIDEYNAEESSVPIKPGSLMGHEYRRRSRESARRACNLLLRLAKFYHEPAPTRSSPRGGGGSRSEPVGDARTPHGPRVQSPTLENLLAQIKALAPKLDALSSVAVCGGAAAPASDHQDREPSVEPPSHIVEISVPQLEFNEPAPLTPTNRANGQHTHSLSNGGGHSQSDHNEHWP